MEEEPDLIITPVGGGGLLSGTALAVNYFFGNTKVMAAEPEGANDAFRSFQQRTLIPSEDPHTIADGLLTSLGSNTFPVMMNYVEQVVTVDDKAITHAMHWVWERMKVIIEPSSAVPLASLLEQKIEVTGKTIVVVFSGGNVDLNHLPWQNDI
jgi:threonine dehydratase